MPGNGSRKRWALRDRQQSSIARTDVLGSSVTRNLRSGRQRPYLLVMHVIFQNISISRCGCLSMELEAP